VQRTAYLDFVDKAFGRTLDPGGLLGLGKLLMPDEVIPALAPHIHVLAAIAGTTFNLLHLVVGGCLGFLLTRRIAPGTSRRHYWPPD